MGWPSYFEDINEKADDNRMMFGMYEAELDRSPVFVSVSLPLQPVRTPFAIAAPTKPDGETIAERKRAQREKHILALYELMPGHRWRH